MAFGGKEFCTYRSVGSTCNFGVASRGVGLVGWKEEKNELLCVVVGGVGCGVGQFLPARILFLPRPKSPTDYALISSPFYRIDMIIIIFRNKTKLFIYIYI